MRFQEGKTIFLGEATQTHSPLSASTKHNVRDSNNNNDNADDNASPSCFIHSPGQQRVFGCGEQDHSESHSRIAGTVRQQPLEAKLTVCVALNHSLYFSFEVLFGQVITAAFNKEECSGLSEMVVRTVVTGILFIIGLRSMNWTFWTGDHFWHGVVNIVVVTAWLLALQPKPFSCWLDGGDAISGTTLRILTLVQGLTLLTVTAVVTLFEQGLTSRECLTLFYSNFIFCFVLTVHMWLVCLVFNFSFLTHMLCITGTKRKR